MVSRAPARRKNAAAESAAPAASAARAVRDAGVRYTLRVLHAAAHLFEVEPLVAGLGWCAPLAERSDVENPVADVSILVCVWDPAPDPVDEVMEGLPLRLLELCHDDVERAQTHTR